MFLKPLIVWLWIGGLMMAVGTLFAAFPGNRRRRPVDPVSAPVPRLHTSQMCRSEARSCRSRGGRRWLISIKKPA